MAEARVEHRKKLQSLEKLGPGLDSSCWIFWSLRVRVDPDFAIAKPNSGSNVGSCWARAADLRAPQYALVEICL